MGKFGAVCVALACILVIVEGDVVLQPQPCDNLVKCTEKLDTFVAGPDILQRTFTSLPSRSTPTFCRQLIFALPCVNASTAACPTQSVRQNSDRIVTEAAYMCSEVGRAELVAIDKSDCNRDEAKQTQIKEAVNSCTAQLNVKTRSICEYRQLLSVCIFNAGVETCGIDYVKFLARVLSPRYFNFAGCPAVVYPDKPIKIDRCVALRRCTFRLKRFVLKAGSGRTNFALFSQRNINPFCRATQSALQCVNDRKAACKSDFANKLVDQIASRAGYICSPAGRKETLTIARSPCITNTTIQQSVRDEVLECYAQAKQEWSDFVSDEDPEYHKQEACQHEDRKADCIINAGTRRCGGTYVRYVIGKTILPAKAKLGCPPATDNKAGT